MLNLFCALNCEAKPLIDYYKLVRHPDSQKFPVYLDRENKLSLTITGPGKVSAAAAVMHTAMLLGSDREHVWINIGIAGHISHPTGSLVLANRIIDRASGKTWYPQIIIKTNIKREQVLTLDKPSPVYPGDGVIDMEASGFYEIAARTGLLELSHCLKIISDNNQNHYSKINKKYASGLISNCLEDINSFITGIAALTDILPARIQNQSVFTSVISGWHFTHSQQLQLKAVLQRWKVLLPDEELQISPSRNLPDARSVLAYLDARLDEIDIHFPGDTAR